MTRLLLVTVTLLLVMAGPAGATLLVRSNGTDGLVVMDKNGLTDIASMTRVTVDGQPGYQIRSANLLDVFDFDFQSGCSDGGDRKANCKRFNSKVNVALAGGNDSFSLGLIPNGTSSVAASSGNDDVSGHPGVDNLNGGTGNDDMIGMGGADTVNGRDGEDKLRGGDGNDSVNGDNDDDTLDGDDNLVPQGGGQGADTLSGGAGNDTITSKEPDGAPASVKDTVTCGTGQDFVIADLKDTVSATSNAGGGTCEEVDRSPVGETPHVRLPSRALRVSRSGRVRVRLRCPRGVRSLGCNGRLQLRVGSGGAGSSRSRRVRYRIRAGRRKTVTLKLTRADVRRLRGKRRRGILTSVERGRIGPKTTIRNPRLKLRR